MPTIRRATVNPAFFNPDLSWLPYNLQRRDFENTMTEIYDFLYELNLRSVDKGWQRLDDMLPAQSLSGMMSAMVKVSLAQYSRALVGNTLENGFPDLVPRGMYPANRVQEGEGVEVKSTNKEGGAVDMHAPHEGWICVFVYETDTDPSVPLSQRRPFTFTEIFCGYAYQSDYRLNSRGQRGTPTATLDGAGLIPFRKFWVYVDESQRGRQWFRRTGHMAPDLDRRPLFDVEYPENWHDIG